MTVKELKEYLDLVPDDNIDVFVWDGRFGRYEIFDVVQKNAIPEIGAKEFLEITIVD